MPIMQAMAGQVNQRTHADQIAALKESHAARFADPRESFEDLMDDLGVTDVGGSPAVREAAKTFLASFPDGIKAALKAVIAANLARDEPWEMTFAWVPAYDFGITIHEAPATVVSRAGITVIVQSRYPLDDHPSTIAPPSKA